MNTIMTYLGKNPVLANELRIRMRGKRAYLILAGHLLLLSALVVLIYIAIYEDTQNYSSYAYGGGFQRARMAPWWSPRRPTLIMPAMR